uniref:Uncharacterized protein n=1 Tax=Arundo donax TaxID=35708 RepID=A0A0A9GV45_ARUDO
MVVSYDRAHVYAMGNCVLWTAGLVISVKVM